MFKRFFQNPGKTKQPVPKQIRKPSLVNRPKFYPCLDPLENRLAPAGFFASGADAGAEPAVRIFDAMTGQEQKRFLAFDSGFTGGVRVAVADINGDEIPDIIAAAGPGGGPHVKAYNGRDFSLMASFLAFDGSFTGGVNIAGGDINHDGFKEIIVGAGAGGGPHVRVFELVGGKAVQIGGPDGSFMAYNGAFRGGVTVAAGNLDGLPGDEIVTGAGPGGGPHVKVFGENGAVLQSFEAYGNSFRGGVFVASGNLNKDQRDDIITGPGGGGSPHVKVFNGQNGGVLADFLAYGANFTGGVRVASADVNDDGFGDIVTGAGPLGGPHARVFDGQTLSPINGITTFENGFVGGIYSAAGAYDPGVAKTWQVKQEAPLLSRLSRFVPNIDNPYPPTVKDWVKVDQKDSNLKGNVYVVAHGFAYGYQAMVKANSKPDDPLKWWETLDKSLKDSPGEPNASEMFLAAQSDETKTKITPTGLAAAIMAADPKAVVLAYSWVDDSAYDHLWDNYQSEAYTHMNGIRLARALDAALPTDFHSSGGNLHIIGHSHGSKVATVAVVDLERSAVSNPNLKVAHLTILDSPEDATSKVFSTNSSNNLWYFLGGLNIGRTADKTFVDNYISYFDFPLGPIQGFDPLKTSDKKSGLQQIVDVDLTPGTYALDLSEGDSHAYSFNWYSGAIHEWGSNSKPDEVLGGQSVLRPDPATFAGKYTQTMKEAKDPQFALTPGVQTQGTPNTQSKTSSFTDLKFNPSSVTSGSTFSGGTLKLIEDGKSTATFSGKFVPVGGFFSGTTFSGISFNYQFAKPVAGDQLVITVNTGYDSVYQLYYVMTGSVAGTEEQFATLSLGSLAHERNATIQIQLVPATGSTGAEVTITNMQQFTSPK